MCRVKQRPREARAAARSRSPPIDFVVSSLDAGVACGVRSARRIGLPPRRVREMARRVPKIALPLPSADSLRIHAIVVLSYFFPRPKAAHRSDCRHAMVGIIQPHGFFASPVNESPADAHVPDHR